MLTRIFLLAAAFAFLPACKKAPEAKPPTQEEISSAEEEIKEVALKIGNKMLELKGTSHAGTIEALKIELDELKLELDSVREKYKGSIPLARSKEIEEQAIQETRELRDELNRKIKEEHDAALQKIEEQREQYEKQKDEEFHRELNRNSQAPFKLPE